MTTRHSLHFILALSSFAFVGCDDSKPVPKNAPKPPGWFVDVTESVGVHFQADRESADYFMPESLAAGLAVFDANGDGRLDLYLLNGHGSDGQRRDDSRARNRLYLQQEDGRFVDATDASGAGDPGYGMGVAVGDIDADGDLDLYITNFGPDRLYRNEGAGRFVDVTVESGIQNERWGASAGFFDADDDGDLDLFVTNYVDYDPEKIKGRDGAGRPEYPGPERLSPTPDCLFQNDGNGHFTDVSAASGIAQRPGKGLGVVFEDLDEDGRIDIYVANDREPNAAWINQGNGRFEDRAEALGLAVNADGRPEASMGIAVADCDGDSHRDLLLTHFAQETHTLYRKRGDSYIDGTSASGLGAATLAATGWGAALADFDLDGDPDLAVANGRVLRATPVDGVRLGPRFDPYAEADALFQNDGTGRFVAATAEGGDFTKALEVGRGLAAVDLDNDGDLDLVVTNGNGTAKIYRNEAPRKGHWVSVDLRRSDSRRTTLGSLVLVTTQGRTRSRMVTTTASYLTAIPPTVHFGLGASARIESLRVRWAGGNEEIFGPFDADRGLVITEGQGRPR